MSQSDMDRFRRRCGQFRGLAVFMVVSVGTLLALAGWVRPLILWRRDGMAFSGLEVLADTIWNLPAAFYLFAVWSIGRAMGQLSKGRLIQPTLASALRRVGIALGLGGLASVFLVVNLLRLVKPGTGGYLHFDVPGMTLGMIGGALFLLGRVADQASRVQAELDEMI
ncbi:hypothetical protein [Caulobacter sp. AP07]|uniref:hypothetical protein n=1 Tax=Caulobacter sp. AP07 TaxID=1144304 RepID=UPI0002EF80A2|nr:hypothetical protein [Caulobacter sp. AP07]